MAAVRLRSKSCCWPPATRPRLPFGEDDIIYYRDLQDYHRLRQLAKSGSRYLVIGGGFIGSELAAALAMVALPRLSWSFPGHGIGASLFPANLSSFITDYYARRALRSWRVTR